MDTIQSAGFRPVPHSILFFQTPRKHLCNDSFGFEPTEYFNDLNHYTYLLHAAPSNFATRSHNPDNGWSVLRASPFNNPHQQETVIVQQTKVFAGATMEFHGAWTVHPKFGRQFKAIKTVERKPATAAALEKYLGSGLIKGVGPKTAKKIVSHFGNKTLIPNRFKSSTFTPL